MSENKVAKKEKKEVNSLIDFPPEIIEHILKRVDFQSVQALRKTSVDFREFIDVTKFECNLTALGIDARQGAIAYLFEGNTHCVQIEYRQEENGCTVICGENQKFLENEDFLVLARNDLNEVMKRHNGVLEGLSFSIRNRSPGTEFMANFTADLAGKLIETEFVEVNVTCPKQIIPMLHLIDPNYIKRVLISNLNRDPADEKRISIPLLSEHEVWNRAEQLDISGFVCFGALARSFSHFKASQVCLSTIHIVQLFIYRQQFLANPDFNYFVLHFKEILTRERVMNEFGFPYVEGPIHDNELRSWFFHIPSTEKLLMISLLDVNTIIFRVVPARFMDRYVIVLPQL